MSSNNPHDRKSDGGPAFPIQCHDRVEEWDGMSLRDYFAGQALTGLLSNPMPLLDEDLKPTIRDASTVASFAYQFADAVLKARAK